MTSQIPNQPHDEGSSESTPDANKQPSFKPKRVIHLSKPLSGSGTKSPSNPSQTTKTSNPGERLRTFLTAGKNDTASEPQKSGLYSRQNPTPKGVGNFAGGASLIVNAVLMVVLIIMGFQIKNLRSTVSGLLGGLYGNFVDMDSASINTTILVDAQVPMNFMLPIQQNTDLILTQSLAIPNAHIVINSGGLSINAQANITLPEGTTLPVGLNLAVPVQFTVPVTLQLPVNIPISQTGLHQPFTGMQDIVRSYYCTFNKDAQYPQGIYLCDDHAIPPSTP
jgi:hypothetical protein